MKKLFANWKTSLFGVLAVVPQVLSLYPDIISSRNATVISLILIAAGFTQAKDRNVTGGTVINPINDASVVKSASKTDQS